MSITDQNGVTLEDNAPCGSKKSLRNPFSATPTSFTKFETSWKVDPGQLIAQATGDKSNPLMIIRTPVSNRAIFRKVIGNDIPNWLLTDNLTGVLDMLATVSTRLVHKTNSKLDVYNVFHSAQPLYDNPGMDAFSVDFDRLEILDYKLVTV